jgi:hypothetical protein
MENVGKKEQDDNDLPEMWYDSVYWIQLTHNMVLSECDNLS